MKTLIVSFVLTVLSSIVAPVYADKVVFAGGCFWCMEKDFESLEGVSEAVSGFTGGSAANPTYRGDHAGHYEAVEITYDANVLSYQDLLNHFWVNVDPFDARGQFCDKGPSYLSAIFVENDEQRKLAEMSLQVVANQFPDEQIVTPILPLKTFFPIAGDEIHHQDFYKKSP
ncbi:MAG: peptide-methionine (S)-S-oxide reductase, partial [Gammaproteobacteria bacterium]